MIKAYIVPQSLAGAALALTSRPVAGGDHIVAFDTAAGLQIGVLGEEGGWPYAFCLLARDGGLR